MGINLEEVPQLIHAVTLINREYLTTNDGKLTLTKNWSQFPITCPVKAVIRDISVRVPYLEEFKNIEEVFTQDSVIFILNKMYYGSQGIVTDPVLREGRLKGELALLFPIIRKLLILRGYNSFYSRLFTTGFH